MGYPNEAERGRLERFPDRIALAEALRDRSAYRELNAAPAVAA